MSSPLGATNCYNCFDWSGNRCEININECLSAPCFAAAGVLCIDEVNGYHCQCPSSRAGQFCERLQLCVGGRWLWHSVEMVAV